MLDIEWKVIEMLSEHSDSRPHGLHGYELASLLALVEEPVALRANGTIYKVLFRLNRVGAIESHWEEAEVALAEGRPRRRYWVLTENGRARAANLRIVRGLRRYLRRLEAETHAAYRV